MDIQTFSGLLRIRNKLFCLQHNGESFFLLTQPLWIVPGEMHALLELYQSCTVGCACVECAFCLQVGKAKRRD